MPLGYDVCERKLVVNEAEAAMVQRVFDGFIAIGCATRLVPVLRAEGARTRTSRPFDIGAIYKVLNNRTHIGKVVHKGNIYSGEHQAIAPQELGDAVHAVLQQSPGVRASQSRGQTPTLLPGLIFWPDGRALLPSHTQRRGKIYTYYVSQAVLKGTDEGSTVRRISAGEIETAVIDQVRVLLRQPEVVTHRLRLRVRHLGRPKPQA